MSSQLIPFLASKYLHIQVLVDEEELTALFQSLSPFQIFSTLGLMEAGKNIIAKDAFLSLYKNYIELLKAGKEMDETPFRFTFTALLTSTEDAIQRVTSSDKREMIRPKLPCIQVQPHRFIFSSSEHKFYPMVFGKDAISWGLQFSYPQLFQDPVSRDVKNSLEESFPNALLFRQIQLWIRKETLPSCFIFNDKETYVPIRIGKKCFSWINNTYELKKQNLRVKI